MAVDDAQSSTSARLFSNIASSSVGNPAMMSAPIAMSGRCSLHPGNNLDRLFARMAALHALEDQVIARLQAQMHMRHDAGFASYEVEQTLVDFDPVDRRQRRRGRSGTWR
jgi:hypothetical protein